MLTLLNLYVWRHWFIFHQFYICIEILLDYKHVNMAWCVLNDWIPDSMAILSIFKQNIKLVHYIINTHQEKSVSYSSLIELLYRVFNSYSTDITRLKLDFIRWCSFLLYWITFINTSKWRLKHFSWLGYHLAFSLFYVSTVEKTTVFMSHLDTYSQSSLDIRCSTLKKIWDISKLWLCNI